MRPPRRAAVGFPIYRKYKSQDTAPPAACTPGRCGWAGGLVGPLCTQRPKGVLYYSGAAAGLSERRDGEVGWVGGGVVKRCSPDAKAWPAAQPGCFGSEDEVLFSSIVSHACMHGWPGTMPGGRRERAAWVLSCSARTQEKANSFRPQACEKPSADAAAKGTRRRTGSGTSLHCGAREALAALQGICPCVMKAASASVPPYLMGGGRVWTAGPGGRRCRTRIGDIHAARRAGSCPSHSRCPAIFREIAILL